MRNRYYGFSLSAVRFCNCIEGGILIFKEKSLFEKAKLIRDCGIDRTKFRDELGEISPDCDIRLAGYSATMSNVNGYIGLKQMEHVDELLASHHKQANRWLNYFSERNQYVPITCKDCEPNYWIFGLLSDRKREEIIKFREMGYYASGVHIRNDFYSVFGKQNADLAGVEKFYGSFGAAVRMVDAMNVVWKRIKHKDIGPEELKEIAKVKDQYWTYGIDSQIEWIQKNLSGDDIHLLGYCRKNMSLRLIWRW